MSEFDWKVVKSDQTRASVTLFAVDATLISLW